MQCDSLNTFIKSKQVESTTTSGGNFNFSALGLDVIPIHFNCKGYQCTFFNNVDGLLLGVIEQNNAGIISIIKNTKVSGTLYYMDK